MAATTSVKMRQDDKKRLDALQAQLLVKTGKKLNQQELLGELVRLGEKHLAKPTRRRRSPKPPEFDSSFA